MFSYQISIVTLTRLIINSCDYSRKQSVKFHANFKVLYEVGKRAAASAIICESVYEQGRDGRLSSLSECHYERDNIDIKLTVD